MKFVGPSSEQAINVEIDIFGRDDFANGLLNIFKTSDDPLVIALDDEWGTGKTVFARRLANKAAKVGVKAIYYDAFKRDYNPDVFVSLVAQVIALEPKTEKTNELKKKAIGVAKVIGKTLLKGGIRLATAGAINSSSIDEATKGIANEIGDTIEGEFDKFIDERLSNAEKDEMSFDAFRESLAAQVTLTDKGETVPLLFIIDELDRCRPDHALELLETIKHLFAVEHVHFLLATNLNQMRASVNKRYGQDVNSHDYLEKFIHFSVKFPKLEHDQIKAATKIFMSEILNEVPDANGSIISKRDFIDVFSDISVRQNYSLRRIERVSSIFVVSMKFHPNTNADFALIVFLLCDMKISFPYLFQKAKVGKLKYQEVSDSYNFPDSLDQDSYPIKYVVEIWQYLLSDNNSENPELVQRYSSQFHRFGPRKTIIPYFANSILEPISKT